MLLYMLRLSVCDTQNEVHEICKEWATTRGVKLSSLRKQYRQKLKRKFEVTIHEQQNRIAQLQSECQQMHHELTKSHSRLQSMEMEKNSLLHQASQSFIQDPVMQLSLDKVTEERNLLNLQNQHYKSILDDQKRMILELQRGEISSASTSEAEDRATLNASKKMKTRLKTAKENRSANTRVKTQTNL